MIKFNYVFKTKSTFIGGTIAANKMENHPLFLTKEYWDLVKKELKKHNCSLYLARQRTECKILGYKIMIEK